MSMYKKSSTDTMLDTINTENTIVVNPLSLNNVGFGIPQEITTPGALQNARVRVYALMRQGYQGTVDVEYQRLSLDHAFENQTLLVQFTGASWLSDILPAFYKTYGVFLTKDDIVDISVKDLGDDYIVTLETKPSCLMWSGSVDVRVVKSRPNIATLVTAQGLDIVKEPFPKTGKRRLEYVAWGYNFVEIQSAFTNFYGGRATNADLADAINGVVNLNIVYKDAGAVAIGEVNIKGGTCTQEKSGDTMVLRIDKLETADWVGSLLIPWIPEV